MGGQRELRRHESEWHVAPVRSLHESTHALGRNSDANTNCKSNSNCHGYSYRDCDGNSHTDRNGDSDCYRYTNGNSYTYSYADSKADTDSERCANAKASPDTAASFLTEDLINPGIERMG